MLRTSVRYLSQKSYKYPMIQLRDDVLGSIRTADQEEFPNTACINLTRLFNYLGIDDNSKQYWDAHLKDLRPRINKFDINQTDMAETVLSQNQFDPETCQEMVKEIQTRRESILRQ